jgi:hypothetical protein
VIIPREATETDDSKLTDILYAIVDGILAQHQPKELYITAIDNCFDHKWLRFSGIGVVPIEFPAFMNRADAALDEFSQDKVTLPAFSPNRIIRQNYFRRDGRTSVYVKQARHTLLHKKQRESSSKNLHRRIEHISDSGLFVWYSSNTLSQERASMMVYAVKNGEIEAWFASFRRAAHWKLHFTKGIDREFIQELMIGKTLVMSQSRSKTC